MDWWLRSEPLRPLWAHFVKSVGGGNETQPRILQASKENERFGELGGISYWGIGETSGVARKNAGVGREIRARLLFADGMAGAVTGDHHGILTRITNSRRVSDNPLTAPGYTFEVDLHLAATLSKSRV